MLIPAAVLNSGAVAVESAFSDGEGADSQALTENWANLRQTGHGGSMTAVGTYESASEAPSLALDAAPESGELFFTEARDAAPAPSVPAPLDSFAPGDGLLGTEFDHPSVVLVDADGLTAMGAAARASGFLWIALERPGPQYRGRLGLYLEESIEQQLEERGALPPGIHASTGLDASLSDQLYRARLVEMHGIALGIPSLEGITNLGRALDAEDSAVLRWWMAAAADRPVRLVISNENTKLRVYPSPVLFEALFEVAPSPVTPMPPSPAMAESAQTMELSDPPPAVSENTSVLGTEVALREQPALADVGSDDLSEERDWGDVELPDLDRALGLVPEKSVPRPTVPSKRGGKVASQAESAQLPLDYESARAPSVAEQSLVERKLAEQELAEPEPDSEPCAHESCEDEEFPLHEGYGPEVHDAETVIPGSAVEARSVLRAGISVKVGEPLDDLDADEFLRALEEDSSRAPTVDPDSDADQDKDSDADLIQAEVEAAAESEEETESESEVKSEEPSPLPTKKIARSPFIRLAVNEEEHAVNGEEAAANEEEAAESPSHPRTSVEEEQGAVSAPDMSDPFNQLASREWKQWVKNLRAASGPKPLSVIERMFVTDYTRLREAVRRGVADEKATPILNEWQASFEKSYSEAFDALRMRGKRPSMVLDLPDLAQRLSRLQGAKHTQLLLIDGLRFDLGLMVQDRMRKTADASLTERLLLWSALPSNTTYQLELLGKGADGLKERGPVEEDAPALVARGRAARIPRRVRTGSLELLKLDVVEDELRTPGLPVLERMESIADETAAAIVDHINKQAPRTMVIVFGDHGFYLDPTKAGTTEEVRQGGASPEEILVPAFAWLTGAVH